MSPTQEDRPVHRRRGRRRIPARQHAARLRRAGAGSRLGNRLVEQGLTLRSPAAAGRRRRAHHRAGLQPTACAAACRSRNTGDGDQGAGRQRRRWAASWTCWAARSTKPARSTPRSAASIHQDAPKFDELSPVDRTARNRHQGDRPDLPVRQGRQGRPVRRRRRGQDREHDGADQQHRQAARGPVGVRRRGRAHPRGQRLLPRDDEDVATCCEQGGDGVRPDERAAGQPPARRR